MNPTMLLSGHFASYHVMGQCRSITGKPQNGARDFWVDVAKQLYFRLVIPERWKQQYMLVNIEMKND